MYYNEKNHKHESIVVQSASKKSHFTSTQGENANISILEK